MNALEPEMASCLQLEPEMGLQVLIGSETNRAEEISDSLVAFCANMNICKATKISDHEVILHIKPETLDKLCFYGDHTFSKEEIHALAN